MAAILGVPQTAQVLPFVLGPVLLRRQARPAANVDQDDVGSVVGNLAEDAGRTIRCAV